MANEDQVLAGGLFINADGELVGEAPEDGTQLVPAGGFLDDNARARIKAEYDLDGSAVDAYIAEHAGVQVKAPDVVDEQPKAEQAAKPASRRSSAKGDK